MGGNVFTWSKEIEIKIYEIGIEERWIGYVRVEDGENGWVEIFDIKGVEEEVLKELLESIENRCFNDPMEVVDDDVIEDTLEEIKEEREKKLMKIRNAIRRLIDDNVYEGGVPVNDIAAEVGLSESVVEDRLDKYRSAGEIYKPKEGGYKLVGG